MHKFKEGDRFEFNVKHWNKNNKPEWVQRFVKRIRSDGTLDVVDASGVGAAFHADPAYYLENGRNFQRFSQPKKMLLEEFVGDCYQVAKDHGFHEGPLNFDRAIALAHSELSEAHDEYRNDGDSGYVYYKNGKPEGAPIELIDTIIRCFDTLIAMGFLPSEVVELANKKMDYNRNRPYKHGRNF